MRLNFACSEFTMKLSSLEFDDGNERKLLENFYLSLQSFDEFKHARKCSIA